MHAMRRLSRTAGLHVVAAAESDLLALGMLACVVRASKRMAVPDVMVLLVPRIVLPLVVVITGRIAAGPMVALPEACAAWVRAALCLPAIFPVI